MGNVLGPILHTVPAESLRSSRDKTRRAILAEPIQQYLLLNRDLNWIRGDSRSRQLHVHIALAGERRGKLDVDLVQSYRARRSGVEHWSVHAVYGHRHVRCPGRV